MCTVYILLPFLHEKCIQWQYPVRSAESCFVGTCTALATAAIPELGSRLRRIMMLWRNRKVDTKFMPKEGRRI